ncbi:MAG: hypothetical protein CSA86_00800 [Arcobacter sp.]|nr:MAG: hypothetical protein CSA86_00800 [Arcobacter sp.]
MDEDKIIILYKTGDYIRFASFVDDIAQDIELNKLLNTGWDLVSHTIVEKDTGLDNIKDRFNQYILKKTHKNSTSM